MTNNIELCNICHKEVSYNLMDDRSNKLACRKCLLRKILLNVEDIYLKQDYGDLDDIAIETMYLVRDLIQNIGE